MPASTTDTTPVAAERDYDAFFEERFQIAKKDGLSDNMARFVARYETHDRMLADKGLTPFRGGDLELMY